MAKQRKSGEPLGFEATLWAAADKLRGNLESAEYKHVVLGLIFLKYISDAFEERRALLAEAVKDPTSDYFIKNPANYHRVLEDKDSYTAEGVFWVPPAARWDHLQAQAKQPSIGKLLDDAMDAVEVENPILKSVLPKDYGRPSLDKRRLGELIDLIGTIGLGSADHREKDILGRVYEYFLGRFASAEGKGGGEFYTPASVVRVLVEMLEPFGGRVYDPCCGSGGMFVQSLRFVEAHGGRRSALSIFGQEHTTTTWKLAKMNLAIRGIEANLGPEPADSFHDDKHPDLRADYILANPPFNISDWGGERLRNDVRWAYGVPPIGNANYAWLQHIVHHLAPGGTAGVVLANGSMTAPSGGEGEIRAKLVEADLVDCMVALPIQLFYSTGIPVCLWFLARNRDDHGRRDRRGEILFIDARRLGEMVTRVHRVLSDSHIGRIADTYHAWRGSDRGGGYADVPGFCRSATLDEVRQHGYMLAPGRYVGAEDGEEDDEPFDDKLDRLHRRVVEEINEGRRLDEVILARLNGLHRVP
jgi:type I restriction enzyme M protein